MAKHKVRLVILNPRLLLGLLADSIVIFSPYFEETDMSSICMLNQHSAAEKIQILLFKNININLQVSGLSCR